MSHQDGIRRPVVLVVDDDEAVRAIAESDLEDAGYEPLTAQTLSAALAIGSRRDVNVVLLDIVLPRDPREPARARAGLEAIAEFRAVCPAAEIVMLSRFKEAPEKVPGLPDCFDEKIMHASVRIGSSILLASDGQCEGSPNFEGLRN